MDDIARESQVPVALIKGWLTEHEIAAEIAGSQVPAAVPIHIVNADLKPHLRKVVDWLGEPLEYACSNCHKPLSSFASLHGLKASSKFPKFPNPNPNCELHGLKAASLPCHTIPRTHAIPCITPCLMCPNPAPPSLPPFLACFGMAGPYAPVQGRDEHSHLGRRGAMESRGSPACQAAHAAPTDPLPAGISQAPRSQERCGGVVP